MSRMSVKYNERYESLTEEQKNYVLKAYRHGTTHACVPKYEPGDFKVEIKDEPFIREGGRDR